MKRLLKWILGLVVLGFIVLAIANTSTDSNGNLSINTNGIVNDVNKAADSVGGAVGTAVDAGSELVEGVTSPNEATPTPAAPVEDNAPSVDETPLTNGT